MGQNGDIELLKLKVFLYKYTPEFTPIGANPDDPSGSLSKIDRFRIDLNESKYFSKYDITDFVSNYSFEQTITENTFNWSMILQDMPIPFDVLNKNVRVFGPELHSTGQSIFNLAQYEAEMDHLLPESLTISDAKIARGKGAAPMSIKLNSTTTVKPGLRLSDLIQKYDIISVFLYKDITPLDQLKVTVANDSNGFQRVTFGDTGRQLTASDLQQETILLSPGPNEQFSPFFSNEFNGFVMNRTVTKSLGAVDTISLSGNGITRLFGSTRRILKSSIMQASIYNVGDIPNPEAFTAFQNIYAGQLLEAIFADLFQTVYRITFITQPVASAFDNSGSGGLTFGPPPQPKVSIPGPNFFDISSLKVSNTFQTNLFTIPPFLLAQVMKLRGFSYRQPVNAAAENQLTQSIISNQKSTSINQNDVNTVLNSQSSLNPIISLLDPVSFDSSLNELRAYFLMFEEVFRDFNAELKTPFEIINEIKSKTYLEFFEQGDGQVIVRPPNYNSITDVVYSSQCGVIDTSYAETADNFVSRHKVAYALDVLGQVDPTREYAFTDGKLLLQYGFMESGTDANPNVQDKKEEDKGLAQTKESGLFEYAKYFLLVGNASLRTGTIKIDLDPSIQVGQTFFDADNNKFGYIVGVSKNVSPGAASPVTMTLRLAFVRDAVDDNGTLRFEQLPRIIDIANKLAGKA
jgi:hypothetical protein